MSCLSYMDIICAINQKPIKIINKNNNISEKEIKNLEPEENNDNEAIIIQNNEYPNDVLIL